jgi:quinol monooxygenase YgiN
VAEVVIVAKLTPKAGRGADLAAFMAKAAPWFHANEPDTLVYSVCRSDAEDGPMLVIEKYTSPEAFDLHKEHLGALAQEAGLGDMLEGALDVWQLGQLPFGDAAKRL